MPRLPTKDYISIHNYLHDLWLDHRPLYSLLTPNQQHYLHEFFAPAKDLDDKQLREHRKAVTKTQPSLPHCAGRALRDLDLIMEGKKQPVLLKAPDGRGGQIRVRPLMRPEIDYDKLARALMQTARSILDPKSSGRHRDG